MMCILNFKSKESGYIGTKYNTYIKPKTKKFVLEPCKKYSIILTHYPLRHKKHNTHV